MKLTIDTNILDKENISLGEYFILLMAFYQINYKDAISKVISKKLLTPDMFNDGNFILSDNVANCIIRILMEADIRVKETGINYYSLAGCVFRLISVHQFR